ncbi:MAG: alpha/beta hydrolase [Spirochaetaceae bacterium]|jgi:alpha-beta hydrolase superfamily lysophospholipase|nr:alpha/beta hydrolase [Spirochaetaceae bacterium]
MNEMTFYITARDGAKLWTRRWSAECAAKGVVLVVHGMAEHSGRYNEFAERLGKRGFEVWAFDLRGHGKTADKKINSPAKGGILGHSADRKAFSKMLGDIDTVRAEIEKNNPMLPFFLFGHSFGSFLVQGYIEYVKKRMPAGCLLSGTRGPGGPSVTAGAHFLNIYSFFRGRRHLSRFSSGIVLGGNNKPFRPTRTPYDWLSRDNAAIDAYIGDPLCGRLYSAGFFRDLLWILIKIHSGIALSKIKKELPVYIFSGSEDPVGGMGKNVTALVKKYTREGIKDVEFVLYPNARHEMLHEINREEVYANLLDWLERHF